MAASLGLFGLMAQGFGLQNGAPVAVTNVGTARNPLDLILDNGEGLLTRLGYIDGTSGSNANEAGSRIVGTGLDTDGNVVLASLQQADTVGEGGVLIQTGKQALVGELAKVSAMSVIVPSLRLEDLVTVVEDDEAITAAEAIPNEHLSLSLGLIDEGLEGPSVGLGEGELVSTGINFSLESLVGTVTTDGVPSAGV